MHTDADVERFKRKTEICGRTGCLLWTASVGSNHYGQFRLDGKVMSAHRVAWILTNGPIPDGLWVLHSVCDNKLCVNSNHLTLGTPKTNTMQMVWRSRQAKR